MHLAGSMVDVCKITDVLNYAKLRESELTCELYEYISVCMAAKANLKYKVLAVSEKPEMIKNQ
jgi:hypothetical protein